MSSPLDTPFKAGDRVRRTVRNLGLDNYNIGTVRSVEILPIRLQIHGLFWGVEVLWDNGQIERVTGAQQLTPLDVITQLAALA